MAFGGDFCRRPWSEEDFASSLKNGENPRSENADLEHLLSNVAVSLSVELATLELSVADLLSLSSGVVLDLAVPPGCEVTIRLGAEPLARARLILIGDDIAIEIIEIIKSLNEAPRQDENTTEDSK